MQRESNKYILYTTVCILFLNIYSSANSHNFRMEYGCKGINSYNVSVVSNETLQQSSFLPLKNLHSILGLIWIVPTTGVISLVIGISIFLSLLIRLKKLNKKLKQSSEGLKVQEEKWRKAEKIANIGYFEYSYNDNKVIWSIPAIEGNAGFKSELFFNEYLESIIPEDRDFVKEKVNENIRNGDSFDIEYTIIINDKRVNIRAKGEAITNNEGNADKVIGILYNITDQKKIQKRLEQSEERFRLLSNLTFEGIVIHKNGIMFDSNQSFLSMFEYDRSELIGKNIIDLLIIPKDQEAARGSIKSRSNIPYEVVCITKSGIQIPTEIESREIVYEGGTARVATLRDISKRKEQEANLAYEQWLFNMLMDSIPDSIYFKDVDSRFTRVNKGMLEKHGFNSAADIIGKTDFDLFENEHAGPAFEDEQQIIKTSVAIIRKIEKEVWGDGHTSWVLTTKLPYYDQNGKLRGTYGISRNITDLKNTQDKLQEEKEKFERLYRIVPSAIFTTDTDTVITSWNSMAEELTGFKSSEVLGEKRDEIIKDTCDDGYRLFYETVKKPVINSECSLQRKDGTYITISKSVDCIRDASGNIIGGIESFIDISQRKEYENEIKKYSEELKEINNSKDKFFSIIAHDLRNPFITLLGFTEMLIEDYEDFNDEEKIVYLKEMEKTSRASYELLENLLQWSRSQTGRIKYEPEKIDFNILLNKNIDLIIKNSEMKNISIEVETEKPLFVIADEDMITTVLRNLLTNALKFTERGGKIRISTKDEDKFYCLSVADNGIGMSQEKIDKLFSMESIHSSDGTEGEKGSGLGLVLCKEFIEKHDGKMWIESEEGKGTTFYFTLLKG